MTFLGSYGGGMAGPGAEAGPVPGVPPAYQPDLGQAAVFSAGGGFGAFTQPAGYGFDFHTGAGGYSQWGSGRAAGEPGHAGPGYYRPDPYSGGGPGEAERQSRVAAAEQAMQGLSIAHQEQQKEPAGQTGGKPERQEKGEGGGRQQETNGQTTQPTPPGSNKKMSWANIASQPAKPLPPPSKNKKPGVLPPPVVVGAKQHNMDIGTWDGAKQNGMLPAVIAGPPPSGPPPGPLKGAPGGRGGWAGVAGPRGGRGPPPGPPPPYGPPNGTGGHPSPPPSHPVLEELRSVNEYNPIDFDMNPKNARFFVVKSYSEDDIHRSIKYEIWCSTEHGNKRLDTAFRERDGRGPVFLFFSVNGSGHFCGMAQMLNGVDYQASAGVWAQDKWKGIKNQESELRTTCSNDRCFAGQFKVKWIYVKDVPNSQLRHIRLENNENKPVTNSRDTQVYCKLRTYG